MTGMQIFDATTATPSTAYVKVTGLHGPVVQPYVVLGNPDNGGLTAPTWAELGDWLDLARRKVDRELRKNPPQVCPMLPGGVHNWQLIESGCERTWTGPEVTRTDDDGGLAEGAERVRAVVNALDEQDVSDGWDYFLRCPTCMAEANVDDVEFV
jgi:hypothetical protein